MLALSPTDWKNNENFLKAEEFVKTVKVTNDVANRGVKLAADYSTILTKDNSIRQKIFKVVEKDRLEKLDISKAALNKN